MEYNNKEYKDEIWVDVADTNGKYQISNYARVINTYTNKFCAISYNCKGYAYVDLYVNGVKHRERRCRLVAKAFIPNPDNKPQVNHKNGIRSDDSINNLEWVTASENIKDSWERLKEHPFLYIVRRRKCMRNLYTPEAIAKRIKTLKRKRLEKYYDGWLELEFKG